MPPEEVDLAIADLARRQRRHREHARAAELAAATEASARALAQAQAEEEIYRQLSPNDSAFRPSLPDSLLRGAARATGETARAVRRGRTLTRFEYQQRTRIDGSGDART